MCSSRSPSRLTSVRPSRGRHGLGKRLVAFVAFPYNRARSRVSLTPGSRIGPYEISGQIGAGGMGEVYRPLDPTLARQVATKILPDTFAHDPDRLARFEREAKTLAALSHSNIAQIYGLENADGFRALVMELVEGPDLAQRII